VRAVELASIGTTSHNVAIASYVIAEVSSLDVRTRVEVSERHAMTVISVHCDTERVEEAHRIAVLNAVAYAAASCIVDIYEPKLLAKLLQRRYGLVEPEAREALVRGARLHLERGGYPRRVYRRARAQVVAGSLLAELMASGAVLVEGMVTFRLPGYVAALEEALGRAVDDMLLEREYAEFIRLLRCFVAAQPTRTDRVDLVVGGARLRLIDHDGRTLPLDPAEPLELEGVDAAVNYEDVVISALIAAAPLRIVVHAPSLDDGGQPMDSVFRVFDSRVERCATARCGLCASA
jgi:putative sporulation protein YtxC